MTRPDRRPASPPPRDVTADPEVVWHYTDGPGLISILSGHSLWATSAAFLNDEQEVELGLRRLTDRIADLVRAAGGPADITDAVDPRATSGPSAATFYILSASDSWDSLPLWRLYGGARESYAIGLDATQPLPVLGDTDGHPEVDGAPDDGFVVRQHRWAPVR